jgi:hypothetical protein
MALYCRISGVDASEDTKVQPAAEIRRAEARRGKLKLAPRYA